MPKEQTGKALFAYTPASSLTQSICETPFLPFSFHS
jgi:hypothetical protein